MNQRDRIGSKLSSARQSSAVARRARGTRMSRGADASIEATLVEIARAITGRSSAAQIADIVAEAVRRIVPADRCSVWRALPERDGIELLAAAHDADISPPLGLTLALSRTGYRPVLETGRPLRQADLRNARTEVERALVADGLRARLLVPVVAGGRAIGLISAASRERGAYTAAHARLLERLAVQLAVGLEQARLQSESGHAARRFESERRQRRGAEEAARAAAVIVSELDEQRRLDLIVERAVAIVGGVSGGLNLIEPGSGSLVIRAAYGLVREHRGKVVPPRGGVGYRVLDERRPVIVEDFSTFPTPIAFIDPAPFGPGVGVPVLAHGEILGALIVHGTHGDPSYTDEDVALLQVMADLAAVAVENSRIIKEEQRRRQQLEAIRSVTAELTRELDLRTLLDLILRRASELVNCPAAAVLLWDEQARELSPNAWRGYGDWAAKMRYRLGE